MFSISVPISSVFSVSGLLTVNCSPLERTPRITSVVLLRVTSAMPPSFTCCRKVEYGISWTPPDRALKLLTTVATTTAMTIQSTMFLARSFKVPSSSSAAVLWLRTVASLEVSK